MYDFIRGIAYKVNCEDIAIPAYIALSFLLLHYSFIFLRFNLSQQISVDLCLYFLRGKSCEQRHIIFLTASGGVSTTFRIDLCIRNDLCIRTQSYLGLGLFITVMYRAI